MSPEPSARLAYLGTSQFAATILRRLAASPFRPALVVTPPDRRQGRGRRLAAPPAAIVARELGLDLHQTADVNADESLSALAGAGVELGLVCAFGQFLRAELLDRLELLNVHPSLLPRWRGAAPIERAIMAGDERTGIAIIRVTEELDAGPMGLCEAVEIEPGEDYGTLSARLAELGGELALRALELRAAGELGLTDQDPEAMTYAEKIDPTERRLDPGRPAVEVERVVRALNPHVGAHLELDDGSRLGVVRATADAAVQPPAGQLQAAGDSLQLGCEPGALAITAVRPPGKREMTVADYLRGHAAPRLAAVRRSPQDEAEPRRC
jgi:methionyl-tRNA formyltransferase